MLFVPCAHPPAAQQVSSTYHAHPAGPGFPIRRVDRAALKPLFRRLPRYFLLDSGKVVAVFDGAPPDAKDLLSSKAS